MVYSYELGFLRRPYRDHLLSTASAGPPNALHLENCLAACKRFFEYLLSLPESRYLQFTVVNWAQLVLSILVVSRLTFLMAANKGWDASTTRANIPLAMYLDALSFRFQHLSSTPSDGADPPKNPDVLYIFMLVLGSVKRSYERRVDKIEPELLTMDPNNPSSFTRGHCPIMDPNLSVYFRTPDSTYSSGSSFDTEGISTPSFTSSTLLYHDLWATMTGSWAEE